MSGQHLCSNSSQCLLPGSPVRARAVFYGFVDGLPYVLTPSKLDAAAFWVLYAPIRHPPHRMQGSCCKMFHLQPPTPAALSAKAAKKDAPHTRPPFSPHQWDVSAVPVPHPIQSQGQRLCEYFSHHRNFGHGWLLDIQSAAASLLRTGGFRLSQIWLPAERLRRCKIFVPYSSYPHQYKCQTCFTPLRGWCFCFGSRQYEMHSLGP